MGTEPELTAASAGDVHNKLYRAPTPFLLSRGSVCLQSRGKAIPYVFVQV